MQECTAEDEGQKAKTLFIAMRVQLTGKAKGVTSKVTSHIPEDVSESFKRNRINQIYDILKPVEKDSTEKSGTDNNDTSNKTA